MNEKIYGDIGFYFVGVLMRSTIGILLAPGREFAHPGQPGGRKWKTQRKDLE